MLSRKCHRYIGLVMLIPMITWALTGLVFFIKPGYSGAYEMLTLKTYPLTQSLTIAPGKNWQEARLVKSIIGEHLLVKSSGKLLHLNAVTLTAMPAPKDAQLSQLFEDTIAHNIARYGSVKTIESNIENNADTPVATATAITSNNITLSLNWQNLTFTQRGSDRALINLLYKVHYLQWTPWAFANQVLGILGLILLISLSVLGIKVYLNQRE